MVKVEVSHGYSQPNGKRASITTYYNVLSKKKERAIPEMATVCDFVGVYQ
jgi:hypothetical protein